MSILTFNFHIDLSLCDQIYNQEGLIPPSGFLFKRKACYDPNIPQLNIIKQFNPDLVIICTQGESGYFHTDFLPNFINYDLLSHQQYKDINLSIYTNGNYELDNYIHDTDGYTDVLTIYINSPYGLFSFIAVNRQHNTPILNINRIDEYLSKILNHYNKNIDYYFILSHFPGYKNTYCDFNKNKIYDNITDYGSYNQYDIEEKGCKTITYEQSTHQGIMNYFELKPKNSKVLCFCWNTDKTPLCDQNYNNDKQLHYRRFIKNDSCYNPLFFNHIKQEINIHQPDIVVINHEGDLKSGTFFHYQYLRREMTKLKYKLLVSSKVNYIDVDDTMRLSIYIKNYLDLQITHINRTLFSYNEEYTCDTAKAMVKYIETGIGIIAFLAVQMPDSYTPEQIDQCVYNINKDLIKKEVSYVFMMGDFNNQYFKSNPIFDYNEGKGDLEDYQHDRIFYKTNGLVNYDLICLDYKTIYGFPMLHKGTHLGMLGIYEFIEVNI